MSSLNQSLTDSELEGTIVSLLAAFDHLADTFVFVKDVDRRFVACTLPFVELMGCRGRDEIVGRSDEDFSPPHLVEQYRKDDEAVLQTGANLIDIVELVGRRDDTYEWFTTSKSPMRHQDGAITGLIGVTRRISARDSVTERFLSLTPAVEFMCREYRQRLTVKDLAAQVQMSTSHFNRLFREHFGVSPYKYLLRVRVTAVCDLLATTDLPINSISERTGFYDSSHLTNEFKLFQGVSPREYRLRIREIGNPGTYRPARNSRGMVRRVGDLPAVQN